MRKPIASGMSLLAHKHPLQFGTLTTYSVPFNLFVCCLPNSKTASLENKNLSQSLNPRIKKLIEIFSSSKLFDEDHIPLKSGYNGFYYDHGHIYPVNENESYIDLSITKNVFFLFLYSFNISI